MKQVLQFLIRCCLPLFERHGFRFQDSGVGRNVAAGAWILIQSADVQLHLVCERNELVLQFRSVYDTKKKNWFSIDLISELLGRNARTGLMDDENCSFLAENVDQILAEFRKDKAAVTIARLNHLKERRTKRM